MDPQHHAQHESGADLDPSDRELIDLVRDGDLESFDPLYRRHRDSGLRHARYWTRSEAGAEDLCAEAFTRVLYAIRNGNGPTEAFRPYLLTTMRNVARDWAEGDRRTLLVPDLVDIAPAEPDQDPVIAALERSLAGAAFSSLPERWQTVLWQTEVEQEAPARLAPQFGIDAAAVSALAYRAREGLKQAYLQAHISEIGSPSCRPFAERLGTHTRGKLRGREAARVRRHLRNCGECVGLFAMLKYVNGNLGALIGPAVVGTAVAIRIGTAAGGVAAGAGAGGGAAAQHGLMLRMLSKARHASPRHQAVAAGATAAVAAAALALALTGNGSQPPPAAAARPSPATVTPTPPPAAERTPAAPKPSIIPPRIVPSSAPPAKPAPATPRATPASAAPTAPAPTTPAPSPSPSIRVLCPNGSTVLTGVDLHVPAVLRLQTALGRLVVAQVGGLLVTVDVATDPGCATGGPPRPLPLPCPDGTASAGEGAGGD